MLKGVEAVLCDAVGDPDVNLDKVGFARHVLAVVAAPGAMSTPVPETAIEELERNFRSLFVVLGRMQRRAMTEHASVKTSERVGRAVEAFLDDHPAKATKAEVQILFEQIGYTLDSSRESEDVRSEMRRLSDLHQLHVDPSADVSDMNALREDLVAVSLLSRQKSQVPPDEPMSLASPAQPPLTRDPLPGASLPAQRPSPHADSSEETPPGKSSASRSAGKPRSRAGRTAR